jgi:hypothetical protein
MEGFRPKFTIEILLGTSAELPRNFYHGITPTLYWNFS